MLAWGPGQAAGSRPGAPPLPRFPRPAAQPVAPARAGLPLGRPQTSSRARGTPPRQGGRSRAGLRQSSPPAPVQAVPSPASSQATLGPRPAAQLPAPPAPQGRVQAPSSQAWRGRIRGLVWNPREPCSGAAWGGPGGGPQHARLSCPLPALGSLWAAFVSSFQPDPQASPSPGFSGVEERAREGGGLCWRETRPHPETCRWAPARRGFKEAEPAPGSHPCRPGPRLEERRLCQPVTQTLGLGSDPSPVVPACSSPPGCCPDPAPIRCCPLLPPTPTAGTPGWSRHMPFLFSGPWSWNSHAAQGH